MCASKRSALCILIHRPCRLWGLGAVGLIVATSKASNDGRCAGVCPDEVKVANIRPATSRAKSRLAVARILVFIGDRPRSSYRYLWLCTTARICKVTTARDICAYHGNQLGCITRDADLWHGAGTPWDPNVPLLPRVAFTETTPLESAFHGMESGMPVLRSQPSIGPTSGLPTIC